MKKIVGFIVCLLMMAVVSTPTFAMEEQGAKVRVVHLSPDAPAVDVAVDGKVVVKNLAFKGTTNYLMLPGGKHKVEIYAAGTADGKKAVITREVQIDNKKSYTVAAIGKVANLDLQLIGDDVTTVAGKAKVRVGHFSPDVPAVDIAVKGGPVLFSNAPFKAVTNYAEVNPGKIDLEVRVAGTDKVVLDLAGVEFKPDTTYTVLAVGLATGQPALSVIILTDSPVEKMGR